ncbi:MAG TPA: hypothetical protein VM692_16215 [Gammaproteobacteria bacterium]|nr:hypothetical protein [Gammaproteobacteria bacterium]
MRASTVGRVAVIVAAGGVLAACDGDRAQSAAALRTQDVAFPGGAGSAEPRLTSGPDGTPVLSWLEPAGDAAVLRFSTFASGAFGTPHEVTRGDDLMVNWADLPSVQPIARDVWAAHWLKNTPDPSGAYNIVTAVSADGGRTWTSPAQLNDDDTMAEHGFVELFAWNDSIAAFWLDGRQLAEFSFDEPDKLLGTSLRIARLDESGAAVSREIVDELVCDCCAPDHAMASAGPVVVYRDRTPEEIRDIAVRRFADGRWHDAVAAGTDNWHIEGCPVNGPKVAAAGARVGVAWFAAPEGAARVRFAWSTDGAASFAPALALDGAGSFGQVGLLLAADGTAIVSWWRSAQGGGTDLVLRTVGADSALGKPQVVAHSAAVQPVDVPQLVRAGDDVLVAWTNLDDETVHTLLVQSAPRG